jgi:hypothetical protein
MTVIEFGKRDYKVSTYTTFLIVMLVLSAVFGIALYTSLINLRHDVAQNEDALNKLQVQTAEMRNSLLGVMDGSSDPSFIQSSGLVLDKNPQYFTPKELISQATR